MSVKIKLFATIFAFLAVIGLIVMGVFSLNQTSINMGGKIIFDAKGIEATIEYVSNSFTNGLLLDGQTLDTSEETDVMQKVVLDNYTSSLEDVENVGTWNGLKLSFNEKGDEVSFQIKITNNYHSTGSSNDNILSIDVSMDLGKSNNVSLDVQNMTDSSLGRSAMVAPEDFVVFKVTFAVSDVYTSATLENFKINFFMENVPQISESASTSLSYTFDSAAKEATVTAPSFLEGSSNIDLVIPKFVANTDETTGVTTIYKVTKIANRAFAYCNALKSVTLPDTMKTVGALSFMDCANLEKAYFPDTVTEMGSNLFANCLKLESFTIPKGVTYLGEYIFWNCPLITEMVIHDDVTYIGTTTFSKCTNLTKITIGKSLKSLGSAPKLCDNLTTIIVDPENPYYDSRNNCNAIISKETDILQWGCKTTVIPTSVVGLSREAFQCCQSITSLPIGSQITYIGKDAVPLSACENIDGVYYLKDNTGTYRYLISADKTIESCQIKEECEVIAANAFESCTTLKNVTLPTNLKIIESAVFKGCTSLESISIPDSVESIEFEAFRGCKALVSAVIGNGVKLIDSQVFYDCTKLTNVTLGNSVTSIGNNAFYNCSSLANINFPFSIEIIGDSSFRSCGKIAGDIVLPNCISIGNNAFRSCGSITGLTFGKDISLGDGAFAFCSNLTEITNSVNIKSIGSETFYYCSNLVTELNLSGLTTIGSSAFRKCSKLKGVVNLINVSNIGTFAFDGCQSITGVIFGDNLTTINSSAFQGCDSLQNVYYTGTEEEWNNVTLNSNSKITSATKHFGYTV